MGGTKHKLSELELAENIPESQHLLGKKHKKGKHVGESDFESDQELVSSEMDEDETEDPEMVFIPALEIISILSSNSGF